MPAPPAPWGGCGSAAALLPPAARPLRLVRQASARRPRPRLLGVAGGAAAGLHAGAGVQMAALQSAGGTAAGSCWLHSRSAGTPASRGGRPASPACRVGPGAPGSLGSAPLERELGLTRARRERACGPDGLEPLGCAATRCRSLQRGGGRAGGLRGGREAAAGRFVHCALCERARSGRQVGQSPDTAE